MTAADIDPEEADWIKSYAAEVKKVFSCEFDAAAAHFSGSERLFQRFIGAISTMLSKGRALITAVDEAHNELCIASQLLANSDPLFTRLEYEPTLPGCARSIDFRALTDHGLAVFVDVKTIKPKPKDRWDQFQKAVNECWFPENVRVALAKEWLGGELWHNVFTARSRMLEYALQLEAKIRDCHLGADNTLFILALCGEGFHWRRDSLEDFVAFYRNGRHRADDPFAKAEAKYIAENGITLDRTISRFASLSRPQFNIRQRRVNWNVQPPRPPVF